MVLPRWRDVPIPTRYLVVTMGTRNRARSARALMYFRESSGKGEPSGWFCACGYQIVQPPTSFTERYRALKERRAKVLRKSMAVRARAGRLRRQSRDLRRRRKN